MTNEFKSLTDSMVLILWSNAILAYSNTRGTNMPVNDRNYLLQRKLLLRDECVRRGLVLRAGQ